VPPSTPTVEVKRDGVVIGSAAWGTAIPVDSGTHKILVTAPGKQWETTVQAAEGKTARVVVPRELPAAPPSAQVATIGPQPPPGVAETTVAPDGSITPFPPPVVENRGSTQRALGWIVAGVGAVGLGVGAGFGLSSISKRDESRDHCVVDACNAEGVALRDDALRNGNIATFTMIGGAAAVAGGLVLVLTAPKGSHEPVGKLRAVPTAAVGGGGFMLQGNFQ
jgi:hypothetical protein